MFGELSELFNSDYVLPVASFGAIGAASWLLLDRLSTRTTRSEQRLKSVCDPLSTDEKTARQQFVARASCLPCGRANGASAGAAAATYARGRCRETKVQATTGWVP